MTQGGTVPNAKIWLIGGTSDSRILAQALVEAQIPTQVTITTAAGRSLYPTEAGLGVTIGRLEPAQMPHFIKAESIALVLDASHPFATVVSHGAIAAAQTCGIPYLRYERATLSEQMASDSSLVHRIPHCPTTIADLPLTDHRALLVLGYRPLPEFRPWHDRSTLFARILPSEIALKTALESGFQPDRLIALRPPVSLALEMALWQQWQISVVIAKESGQAGGEDVKRQVAAQLGVPLWLLQRPTVVYPAVTGDVAVAIDRCRLELLQYPS
ncbi:MAG: cobalt-precorrin-6A reductase [Prochlorothrix sp.]|nr:cobalt-precorrin-6A reductase [Prochlorothrix sp.]